MEHGKASVGGMRRLAALPMARAGFMLIVLTAAGCGGRDDRTAALAAVQDGSAKAALQRRFDAAPECAPVLDFWSERGLLEAEDDNPGAAALVSAGLLEPVAGDPRPRRRAYRPTQTARQWFRNVDPAEKTRPYLCFARRVVGEVSVVPDGDMASLRYTFTLQDPPRWMARADMIAAFPGVALAYGTPFASDETVRFDDGKPGFDPTYMTWNNSPYSPFRINFRGYDAADFVDADKIAALAK